MPFYAGAAYSIGALMAPRMPAGSLLASTIRSWARLIVRLIFLAVATSLLIQAKQFQSLLRQSIPNGLGELRWFLVSVEFVPVAVGAGLIYFADWLRRAKEIHSVADSRVGPVQS